MLARKILEAVTVLVIVGPVSYFVLRRARYHAAHGDIMLARGYYLISALCMTIGATTTLQAIRGLIH